MARVLSLASANSVEELSALASTDDLLVRRVDGSLAIVSAADLGTSAGARRYVVGPAEDADIAASQTDTDVPLSGAGGYVMPRDGQLVGLVARLDEAVTGAGLSATVQVQVNGSDASGFSAEFTQAGGETELTVTPTAVALSAGDVITVVYSSGAITNTPALSAWVQVEEND